MSSNGHEAFGESPKDENLNCWQPLKPPKPQREDETSLCVTTTKVEKIRRIVHGESLKILVAIEIKSLKLGQQVIYTV
jgi:hypothetical protein